MNRKIALMASLAMCTGAIAPNNAPLSGTWNIAPTGSAASSGELLFRVTPGDGGDPVEVTVTVSSGTNDLGVARDIRQAMSMQLARDRFNVQLGEGANVLVSDPRGRPNFSLELVDSDVENLRVDVRSVDATASPTVPERAVPAVPPPAVPAPNTAPGNAVPPAIPSPGNAAPPTTPSPGNAGQPAAPPPSNSPPVPNGAPPPGSDSAGQPAASPPPSASPGGAASTPPPT